MALFTYFLSSTHMYEYRTHMIVLTFFNSWIVYVHPLTLLFCLHWAYAISCYSWINKLSCVSRIDSIEPLPSLQTNSEQKAVDVDNSSKQVSFPLTLIFFIHNLWFLILPFASLTKNTKWKPVSIDNTMKLV